MRSGPEPLWVPCRREIPVQCHRLNFCKASSVFQLPLWGCPVEKQTASGCHQISFKQNKKRKAVFWSLLQLKYWYPRNWKMVIFQGERVDGPERRFGSGRTWVIYLYIHQISDDGRYMFSTKIRGHQLCRCLIRAYFQKLKWLYQWQSPEHLSADLPEVSTEMLSKSPGHSFALLELARGKIYMKKISFILYKNSTSFYNSRNNDCFQISCLHKAFHRH